MFVWLMSAVRWTTTTFPVYTYYFNLSYCQYNAKTIWMVFKIMFYFLIFLAYAWITSILSSVLSVTYNIQFHFGPRIRTAKKKKPHNTIILNAQEHIKVLGTGPFSLLVYKKNTFYDWWVCITDALHVCYFMRTRAGILYVMFRVFIAFFF